MRAFSVSGLELRFDDKDRHIIESGGRIETKNSLLANQTIIVNFVDKVEYEFLNESGFRAEGYPPERTPDEFERYEIWADKSVSRKLLEDGEFMTRCSYNRLNMVYYPAFDKRLTAKIQITNK